MTALVFAIENEYVDSIKILVSNQKIDLNIKMVIGLYEYTALSYLIDAYRNCELINLLIPKSNPNIILKSKYSKIERTPLSMAIKNNNIEIVKLLLSNQNYDFNTKFNICENQKSEKTALSMAFDKSNTELISILLSNENIDPNIKFINKYFNNEIQKLVAEEKTILTMSIEDENIDKIKMLLSCKNTDLNIILTTSNVNTWKIILVNNALNVAINKGNKDIICLLLNDKRTDKEPIY